MLQTACVCFYHLVCRDCTGDRLLAIALFYSDARYGSDDDLYSKNIILQ